VGDWHFPYFNEEMGKAVDGTHDADVMLFGRVTYDSFAGAWPAREAAGEEDAGFATRLGDMRKIVPSRSPLELTWRNSEQLRGDLVEAVRALKNDPAIRRIVLSGSVSVVGNCLMPVCLTSCICLSTQRPPGRGSSSSRRADPLDTSS
jgi:dihydrofolate reductase